jgi:hypothetical protein
MGERIPQVCDRIDFFSESNIQKRSTSGKIEYCGDRMMQTAEMPNKLVIVG